MTVLLNVTDLTPFAPDIDEVKAEAMIDDAVAMATLSAPCLASPDDLTPAQAAVATAVLRGAVLRWNDAGSGAISAQSAGPYSLTVDTRQPRRALFWPSEITTLQKICQGDSAGGAFSIDTAAAEPMRSRAVFFGSSNGGGIETVGAVAFDDDSGSYFSEL